MRKKLVIVFIVVVTTLNLFAQSASTNIHSSKSTIDNMGIDWDVFTNHPMRLLMGSASLLTTDLYSILNFSNTNEYIGNEVSYLVKFKPLTKYMALYKNAKDEFDRKDVEKQILNDYRAIINRYQDVLDIYTKNTNYFWTGTTLRLSEYSFENKGFGFQPNLLNTFKENLEKITVKNDICGEPFPNFLPMDETTAKQFIHDNPSREIMAYVFLDNFKCYPDQLAYSQIKFIAFTFAQKSSGEKVIAVYPNAEYLSQKLVELESNATIETPENTISSIYDNSHLLNRSELKIIYDKLKDNSRNRFVNLYNEYKDYNFMSDLSVTAQKAIEKNKQYIETQKRKYKTFPKIGVTYKGYQLYPGGIKRSIQIMFTKKDAMSYWGKCRYSNGKKSIVELKIDNTDILPDVKIQFYIPTDNELGAGDGNSFVLSNDGQLVGFELNDKVNYNSYSKTYISIQ